MQSQLHGNERRAILVCVDSCEKGVWDGRFYNSVMKKVESFSCLVDFLVKMEKTLDQMHFPKSFSAVRRFTSDVETPLSGASYDECQTGKAATFLIRILFRQNSSWQGSIVWLEGKQEESFRSVLELIFLMNDALNTQKSTEKK